MSYWQRYIAYLKKWAEEHADEKFEYMSPASYDEWLENDSGLECPLGGDETNDCADCPYAGDYHFVNGECVILDILKHPEEFIDEYSDIEILTLPDFEAAGGILRILVGVDEDGRYYLVLEDDDTAEDVYPAEDETLMETFVRVLDDNLARELGIPEVLHGLHKEYPNLDIECTCSAAPEQYEIWDSEDEDYPQIGYLRLRGGKFTAEYPDAGGEVVFEASPEGYNFFVDGEREQFLRSAVKACVERHKQSK